VHEYCQASLSRVIDLVLKLAYPHIALIGIDLTSPHHFYSSLPAYADVAHTLPARGFEQAAVSFAITRYGAGTHATGARGIHLFLDHLALKRCASLRVVNLAGESLLANATAGVRSIQTVPVALLAKQQWPFKSGTACAATWRD